MVVSAIARTLRTTPLRPFFFSLLVISCLSSKLLHLLSHATSLSPIEWLYFPTLLIQDILLIVPTFFLLSLRKPRWRFFKMAVPGAMLALVTFITSALQITFQLETGAEIDWTATGKFMRDAAGMKMLLSGSPQVCITLGVIASLAKVSTPFLFDSFRNWVPGMCSTCVRSSMAGTLRTKPMEEDDDITGNSEWLDFGTEDCRDPENDPRSMESEYDRIKDPKGSRLIRLLRNRMRLLTVLALIIVSRCIRPAIPYDHLSITLPFSLFQGMNGDNGEFCVDTNNLDQRPFPLAHLVPEGQTKEPDLLYNGLTSPLIGSSIGDSFQDISQHWNGDTLPEWLPAIEIPGFGRWYHSTGTDSINYTGSSRAIPYNASLDPLKITNQDLEILEPIRAAINTQSIQIKHIMMISLESMRKDVFPLKKNSFLHKEILDSHEALGNLSGLNDQLFELTKNAAYLTGEPTGFEFEEPHLNTTSWRNKNNFLKGGINMLNAITAGTYTLKSIVSSHCGAAGLPVDFDQEARNTIYQPCLPQVLKLFNSLQLSRSAWGLSTPEISNMLSADLKDYLDASWKSVTIQAVTDKYDDQYILNHQMGFDESIGRATLRNPHSKHYPPTEEEAHYFGYPDDQVKPYLKDLILDAKKKKERLFISHETGTTHHPFILPKEFGEPIKYFGDKGWVDHETLNSYLNTIRYSDAWLGQIMDLLEETEIANETLVVIVGDHGFSFPEDDSTYTCYDNGHVSNFKVPLIFRHPQLPRLNIDAKASSLSIIPTLLDFLINTGNLNKPSQKAASHLIHEYEAQSLLRPYKSFDKGRQAWNFGLINPGGSLLSVGSAAKPWRLIMPLCKTVMWRFTDTDVDPNERNKIEEWGIAALINTVARRHGSEAAKWVRDAQAVGTWWVWERRRLWGYTGSGRRNITEAWTGHNDS